MMGKISANDSDRLVFNQAQSSVIQRFVEAVCALCARILEPAKILHGRCRIDHGRERGSIGRDYRILAEATLESQSGYAKAGVLIGELEIAHVVRRFGHPPGGSSLRAIFNLAAHNKSVSLVEQASPGRL